eukprot:4601570-Ditylum_brightwellii.AAC.1
MSHNNPKGQLTNSDLKLAAEVIHFRVALATHLKEHLTMLALPDNAAMVHWSCRLAAKADTHTSGALLQGMA